MHDIFNPFYAEVEENHAFLNLSHSYIFQLNENLWFNERQHGRTSFFAAFKKLRLISGVSFLWVTGLRMQQISNISIHRINCRGWPVVHHLLPLVCSTTAVAAEIRIQLRSSGWVKRRCSRFENSHKVRTEPTYDVKKKERRDLIGLNEVSSYSG